LPNAAAHTASFLQRMYRASSTGFRRKIRKIIRPKKTPGSLTWHLVKQRRRVGQENRYKRTKAQTRTKSLIGFERPWLESLDVPRLDFPQDSDWRTTPAFGIMADVIHWVWSSAIYHCMFSSHRCCLYFLLFHPSNFFSYTVERRGTKISTIE